MFAAARTRAAVRFGAVGACAYAMTNGFTFMLFMQAGGSVMFFFLDGATRIFNAVSLWSLLGLLASSRLFYSRLVILSFFLSRFCLLWGEQPGSHIPYLRSWRTLSVGAMYTCIQCFVERDCHARGGEEG